LAEKGDSPWQNKVDSWRTEKNPATQVDKRSKETSPEVNAAHHKAVEDHRDQGARKARGDWHIEQYVSYATTNVIQITKNDCLER
jgi:hypothetical protein